MAGEEIYGLHLVLFVAIFVSFPFTGDNESGKTTLVAKLQCNEDPKKGSGLEYAYIDVRDEYRDGKCYSNTLKNTALNTFIVSYLITFFYQLFYLTCHVCV